MSDFYCPYCEYKLKGHLAIYGKVCPNCFNVTETSEGLRQSLEQKHTDLQNVVRDFLRNKMIRDDYAD